MKPERFSDLRVLRWTERIQDALSGERLGPIRANLDLTNLCQDKCPWCEPAEFRAETIRDKRHTLDIGTAFEVIEDLAALDCKTINFSGGGEPLLHPEFGGILRYSKHKGLRNWIVTNGGFIGKWAEELLGFADHVRISLDASKEAEHLEMHGSKPGEFGKVLENIEELCRRRVNGSPEVGIGYIVADCNDLTDSYEQIFSFAQRAGVDFIHFRPLSEPEPKRFTSEWEQVTIQLRAIAEKYPTVQCFPLGKRDKDVFLRRDFESCYAALTLAVISATGDVCACCDERGKIFGNVHEQPFKEIWLSARHRRMAGKIVPKLCSRCLMCGYNAAVEKFIVNNEALPELL